MCELPTSHQIVRLNMNNTLQMFWLICFTICIRLYMRRWFKVSRKYWTCNAKSLVILSYWTRGSLSSDLTHAHTYPQVAATQQSSEPLKF